MKQDRGIRNLKIKLNNIEEFFLGLLDFANIDVVGMRAENVARVMAGLEQWFKDYPDGFLKHCEKGRKDQENLPGLSWEEELILGKDTIKKAFKRIGVVYPTEEAFNQVKNGVDEFDNKFYCRVLTQHHHRSYYYRNHHLVDSVIEAYKESLKDSSGESNNLELALAE
jgi:hypothetical protein